MNSQSSEHQNLDSQKVSARRTRGILKSLSLKIMLVFWVIIGILAYVMTAPPIEAPKEPVKLQFHDRSALRKRPSLDSAPIAYTKEKGTLMFSVGLGFLSNLDNGNISETLMFSVGLPGRKEIDRKVKEADWHQAFADYGLALSQNAIVSDELPGSQWRITDRGGASYIARRGENLIDIYSENLQGAFENNKISLSQNATLSTREEGRKWWITDKETKQAYDIIKEGDKLNIYKRSKLEIVSLLFSVHPADESDLDEGKIPEPLAQAFEKKRIPLSQDVALSKQQDRSWLITDNQQKYIVKKGETQFRVYLHMESEWVLVRIEGEIKGWVQRTQGVIIQPSPVKLTRRQRAKQRLVKLVTKLPGM